MKITLSAATALALATALVTLPRAADAATPVATFAKMRRAVLAHAQQMSRVQVGVSEDGSSDTWVLVDGNLVPPAQDGTFHFSKDGKDVTVTTSMTSQGGDHAGKADTVTTSTDLSSLPPEQRAQVRKAIADAMAGKGGANVTTTYTVNGQTVDGETAHRMLREHGLDLRIDLDAQDYRTIAFGADHDHLVLTPRASQDRRTVVTLDRRSSLPKNVVLQRFRNGRWTAAGRSNVKLG